MKTSEIIRDRIDHKLAAYLSDYGTDYCTYLCYLFHDKPRITAEIQRAVSEAGGSGIITEHIRYEGHDRASLCHSRQCFRFFFMDMLSYYFESLGD